MELNQSLIIIYINDLTESIISDIYTFLFADDTKILRPIRSKQDVLALQSDISLLQNWSEKWLLKFNTEKCHVLTIGKFENVMYTHRYKMHDNELEHMFEEKDLGVIVDTELKFEEHISTKVNKSNAMVITLYAEVSPS